MAIIRPLRAIRPSQDKVVAVSSKYSKLDKEVVDAQLADNPYSFLNLIKPKDSPNDQEVRNEMCRSFYDQFLSEQVLRKENEPAIYIYKQIIDGESKVGLLVNASVEDYKQDLIRKHEFTLAEKEERIISHIDKMEMMVSPVFLTYRSQDSIDGLIAQCMEDIVPLYDFSSKSDNTHLIWKVDDQLLIDQFIQLFDQEVECMYIADGHHRAAASKKYSKKKQVNNPAHHGEEPYNYFFSVLIASNEIDIIDYNRIVKDLDGESETSFLQKLHSFFEVETSAEQFSPKKAHEIGMFLGNQWYVLKPKAGTYNPDSDIDSLDVSILQDNLLSPILNINDPRNTERMRFVSGLKGVQRLEDDVRSGKGVVAFSLFPVSIESFFSIADSGHIMPPKSTWFEPKIRTGVIMRNLEE